MHIYFHFGQVHQAEKCIFNLKHLLPSITNILSLPESINCIMRVKRLKVNKALNLQDSI